MSEASKDQYYGVLQGQTILAFCTKHAKIINSNDSQIVIGDDA